MKRRSGVVKALVLIIIITGTIQVYRYIAIMNADAIVRIGYTGLENMFHTPYEYYAIGSGSFCKVSKWLVEKRFGEDAEKRSVYDDTENCYWRMCLYFSESGEFNNFDKLYLKTSFGEQYRLFCENVQHNGKLPDTAILKVILPEAEKLCGEYLNNGETPYNDYFIFIQHGEKFFIVSEAFDIILKVSEDGNLTKIMDVSERGDVDYFYFLDTD